MTDPTSQNALLDAVVAVADGLELDEALTRIVRIAADLVDAEFAALGVLGPNGRMSRFVHVGVDDDTVTAIGRLPQGHGVLGTLMHQTDPVRVPDVAAHPQSTGFPAGHPVMRSFLGVPVLVGGRVYGNLYIADKREGSFSDEDERLVMSLAGAAGVALANARMYGLSQQRQKWQESVTEIDTLVLSEVEPEIVAENIARRAWQLSSAAVSILAVPDTSERLVLHAVVTAPPGHRDPRRQWALSRARQLTDDQVFAELAELTHSPVHTHGAIAAAFTTGETVVADEPMLNDVARQVLGPCLALPLNAGGHVIGVLALARFADDYAFSDIETELAEAFARQTAVALLFDLERSERERLAIFEERDRIARDLHDLVIQRLFATGMMLQGAARLAELPPIVAERLDRAVDELDGTIKEIRTTIFDLTEIGDEPSWVSVRARVLAEVERAGMGRRPKPSVSFSGPVDAVVNSELAVNLVAAVREGVSNALRHSGCTRIEVAVSAHDQLLRLTVADDGCGLPAEGLPRMSGLANLEGRARVLGGVSQVGTSHLGGLLLTWQAPLQAE